jgi:hypothetical protein
VSSVDVIVGPELKQWVDRVIKQAAPTVAPRMEQEVRELMAEVIALWPVGVERGRPHTRDGFRTELRLTASGVEARLVNDLGADYFFFIRGKDGGPSVWRTLIAKPALERAQSIADDLADDLARMAGR